MDREVLCKYQILNNSNFFLKVRLHLRLYKSKINNEKCTNFWETKLYHVTNEFNDCYFLQGKKSLWFLNGGFASCIFVIYFYFYILTFFKINNANQLFPTWGLTPQRLNLFLGGGIPYLLLISCHLFSVILKKIYTDWK